MVTLVLCRLKKAPLGATIKSIEQLGNKLLQSVQLNDYDYSVKLTTNRSIRLLNSQFRGIVAATDVLSFPTGFFFKGEKQTMTEIIQKDIYRDEEILSKTEELLFEQQDIQVVEDSKDLGDIVISVEYVERVAKRRNVMPLVQFSSVLVHGFCHLLGYDHQNNDETKAMIDMENRILDSVAIYFGWKRNEYGLVPLTTCFPSVKNTTIEEMNHL
eukprot:jgi/Galph1/243/GphlegSOOS_G5005.1